MMMTRITRMLDSPPKIPLESDNCLPPFGCPPNGYGPVFFTDPKSIVCILSQTRIYTPVILYRLAQSDHVHRPI